MSDMKKLLEAMDSMGKSEKKSTGPKFPGYLKGTDPASKVRDKMVGGAQESVIKELAKTAKDTSTERKLKEEFANFQEGEVVQFPKKHKGDLGSVNDCPKCGSDLQGGKYMGHQVKVCMPCKQVYLPPNSGIDQQGNPIKEAGVAEGFSIARPGQLVQIIRAPRMLDLLPGETFEVRTSEPDGVTLKHGLGTKFDNVKFPHGTYKISKAQGVAEGYDGVTEFYVYIGREGEGSWIGRISKDGGKWREEGGEGTKPHNWGTAYMSYLTPDEVMQWIRQDYRRHEVEGPFLDDAEAYEYAEQMGGLDENISEEQVDEKSVSKAQFRTMAAAAKNPEFAKKVGISAKVAREFHKADKKANYKSLPAKVDEDGQPDAITMDVPLMIRLFEYAREDAKTDMDLHDVAERLIALSQEGRTLTMQDYDTICPSQEQAVDEEQEAKYGNKYQDAVKRVGQKAREQEKRKPVDIAALAAKLAAMNKQVKELKEVTAVAPTGPTTAGGAPATQQGQATDQEAQDLVNTQKNLAKLKSVNPQLNPGLANQALQNIADNPQAPVAGAQMAQTKNLADLVGDALADPQKGSQVATLLQQVQQAKK